MSAKSSTSSGTRSPKRSAGILAYRRCGGTEVLLVHPGGPFWAKKDEGAWSIPKGEFADSEEPLAAARREFAEETGFDLEGRFLELTPLRQAGGKWVHAFAVEQDFDASAIRSNSFKMEWPPRSGRMQSFPEVDRAAWFDLAQAAVRILKSQQPLLAQLQERLTGA